MVKSEKSDQFSPEESRKRMETALRGAKIAGHKPMSEIAPKRTDKRTTARKANRRPPVKSEP